MGQSNTRAAVLYNVTNQRHASTAPSTDFSLLFEVSSRCTVSGFDAFYNVAFRNILDYQLAKNNRAMCVCTHVAATNLGIVVEFITIVRTFLFGAGDKL